MIINQKVKADRKENFTGRNINIMYGTDIRITEKEIKRKKRTRKAIMYCFNVLSLSTVNLCFTVLLYT